MDKHKKKNIKKDTPKQKTLTKPSRQSDAKPAPPLEAKPLTILPPVQCKDTLLLDYDHSQTYSKRKLVSNWEKYAEISDEDENPQMLAADFQKILSAPKSVGTHFTFASERNWNQSVEIDDETTSSTKSTIPDFYKMNMTILKNRVGRLPFYLRQGLCETMFTDDEIANMNYRVNYLEIKETNKPENILNQRLLGILSDSKLEEIGEHSVPKNVDDAFDLSQPVETKSLDLTTRIDPSKSASIEQSLEYLKIKELLAPKQYLNLPVTSGVEALTANASSEKSKNTENIQDWLDDILNEK